MIFGSRGGGRARLTGRRRPLLTPGAARFCYRPGALAAAPKEASSSQCCSNYCSGGTRQNPPTCLANGASCTGGSQCCSSVCTSGLCTAPQSCQPLDGACTANGDCCTGLSCSIPVGLSIGTCQQGATCPSVGQQCSQITLCCPGLLCADQAPSPAAAAPRHASVSLGGSGYILSGVAVTSARSARVGVSGPSLARAWPFVPG